MGAEGIFFLVAGPTATGKTTVLQRLREAAPGWIKDVSVTTRAPRPGEVDGRDYHFWSRERFEAALRREEFLEHALVHGLDFYGTLKGPVEAQLRQGVDVIKDIDVQGVAQVRRVWPYPRTVAVFMVPPAPGDLLARFRKRGAEEATQSARLETAAAEIGRIGEYEYLVCNRDVAAAVAELLAIRCAEHCRRARCEEEFRATWTPSAGGWRP